ncbi:MAG: DUF393 domain-containing protein [Pseudomonadota bacterium]
MSEFNKTDPPSATESQVEVFFNSACPVCNYGINHQKCRSTDVEIQWLDVHEDNSLVQELDRNLVEARKYLHVRDANGNLHIGIDAFILLWRNSPRDAWLGRLFSLPLINQLARIAYFVFANGLYGFNRLCRRW